MVKSREYVKDGREGETRMKLLLRKNEIYIYKMIFTDLYGPAPRASVVKSEIGQPNTWRAATKQ